MDEFVELETKESLQNILLHFLWGVFVTILLTSFNVMLSSPHLFVSCFQRLKEFSVSNDMPGVKSIIRHIVQDELGGWQLRQNVLFLAKDVKEREGKDNLVVFFERVVDPLASVFIVGHPHLLRDFLTSLHRHKASHETIPNLL